MEQENKEAEFEYEVEWDEMQDEAAPLVDNVEQAEDHPVSQPLFVIVEPVAFQRKEAHKGWVGYS